MATTVLSSALVCDDRPNARAAMVRTLGGLRPRWRIESVRPHELAIRYRRAPAHLVLLGIQRSVSTGQAALNALSEEFPDARVIVFGDPDNADTITATIGAGARGYVSWERPSGARSTNVQWTLAGSARCGPASLSHGAVEARLTERELQVLRAMSEGKPNHQIGRELFLAEDTIKSHARRIFTKLRVCDRAEAVAHGFRCGLLT
jgi:DNA-binding NarL/FixJ family response regulator